MTVYELGPRRRPRPVLVSQDGLTFAQCIERCRDGRAYTFTNPNLKGYFYKAPFPADPDQTFLDGASSAITYYDKETQQPASPTLMIYDFDEDDDADWSIVVATHHPMVRR
jgi:hypothetical protein